MPPQARTVKLKKERDYKALDRLGLATGEYIYLLSKHTERARHLPNFVQIHAEGSQKWLDIAPTMPALDDPDYAAKRQTCFDTCDRYCKRDTPEDPVESVIAVQAAGWAMQTCMAETRLLPGRDQGYVNKKAIDYSTPKCLKREAELGIPNRQIPPHTIAASNASLPMFPFVVGTVIQYRSATNDTVYCTIADYGTSQVHGDYFTIKHRDGTEERLTKQQMFDLMDHSMDIIEPQS